MNPKITSAILFSVLSSMPSLGCADAALAAPFHHRVVIGHKISSSVCGKTKGNKITASLDALYFRLIDRSGPQQLADVRRMLDSGVPVNGRFDDAGSDTPLTHAAGFGHPAVVRLLLQRGANPNAQRGDGKTALWEAANADLSETGTYTDLPQPPTPAQSRAWVSDYVAIIRALLSHGANPNIPDQNGVTPLGVAAYRGREAEVAALLQGGANPNQRDHFGKTSLQWAAYIGFPRIVRLLRTHGAWIAAPGLRGKAQRDLDERLMAAISRGSMTEVKLRLRQGADANAHVNLWNKYSPYGSSISNSSELVGFETPLLHSTGSPAMTRLLLQRGADPNSPGGEGETPIHNADAEVGRLLLWRGAEVNVADHSGKTPLMASADDPAKVTLLLAHGAKIGIRDKEGNNAVMVCHDERALHLFLSHGANINARNKLGRTALINAADSTWGEGDAAACDEDWARVLLRHGANPNIQDPSGNTALMLLAAQGDYGYYNSGDQLGLVRSLLKAGTNLNIRNRYGRTALQIAHRYGAKRVARLLKAQRRGSSLRGLV